MSHPVISIRNLGKSYRLGASNSHDTLRDQIAAGFKRLFRNASPASHVEEDTFWALQDVSFDVQEGDILGIIGRNGAGKSTLLKILGQITEPTDGEVRLRGRIASLLEVGTGFHPELSGRENIFLNGAILGMTRREIRRKFDEIVAFSEVEKFIDMPVKRYSSGMYVRLAFAVAAHMDPEILLVDEVLAVGDATFQQKCMGKMDEVTKAGRTILFVSHNMAAIQALCTRGVFLEKGRVKGCGSIEDVVSLYMGEASSASRQHRFCTDIRSGDGRVRIDDVELECDGVPNSAVVGGKMTLTISYHAEKANLPIRFLLGVFDSFNTRVLAIDSQVVDDLPLALPQCGRVRLEFPEDFCLSPGSYSLNTAVLLHTDMVDYVQGALTINVEPGDFFGTGRLPYGKATVLCRNRWKLIE